MSKLTKPFRGVRDGDIYPTEFKAGDECPPELIAAARAVGALQVAFLTLPDAPSGDTLPPAVVEPQGAPVGAVGDGDTAASAGSDATGQSGAIGASDAAGTVGAVVPPSAQEVEGAPNVKAPDRPELIAKLEAAGITFDKRWGVDKLAAALAEGNKD